MTSATPLAAIDFASPMMLGWLAAAALPWLINLWSRRRHVETPWAAVDLLLAAVRERSRRLRWREWLLLALRTAILLLAALAAARPLWRQTASPGSIAERTHHLLVLDQSFSMACETDGATRFERAQNRARQIVEEAPAGDAFTVIAWSDVADNVLGRPTFDATSALAAIDAIECVDTAADLAPALRAADAAIKAARREFPGLGRTQTLFVSDLQMHSWAPALPKPMDASKGREDASDIANLWASLAGASEIVVESVDDGVRENVAITDVTVDPPAPVLDQPLTIAVQLRAFGINASKNIAAELLLDGVQIGRLTATLPPGGETTLRFETRLTDAGNHVFEARIGEDVDSLPVDNRRWLSVEAARGPRVICFADAASAAEDVARALNPRYRDGAAAGAIDVEIAATASLAATELSRFDAVFACNVSEFTAREQRLLASYAAGGGAVVFVLGDRVQSAAYNEMFRAQSANDALEAEPLVRLQMEDQPATGEWRFDPLDYQHPVMKPFAGRSRSGLLGVRVTRYFPLQTQEDSGAVALAFTSGDPALIVGEYGLGRVAVLATDPALATRGEPWSTLAVSPSFVPLVRELFTYLSADRRGERLNRLAGEPLALPWNATGESGGHTQWKTPNGDITSSPPDSRRSGVYTARQKNETGGVNEPGTAIAVNVDPAESDLAAMDAGELNRQTTVHATARMGARSFGYAGAVPLAPYLLSVAAVLVLAELTVAWLFGRGWA